MILELHDICKTYVQGKMDVPVLKNVSLSVEEGEYLAIMGPSGSGKTTLMNIIGCLDSPTSGEYLLEGEDLSGLNDAKLSQVRLRSIGFVFQSFYLLSRQSAVDNVALPLLYAGVRRSERIEIAKRALERVGLEDRTEFKPTQLSGGQCQRVAIARAIVNNPKILLADEPTGALDTKSGEQIMEIFKKLNDEGVTIVMITHEQEIANHAQRILHIRDGRLVDAQGNFLSPEESGPAKEPLPADVIPAKEFLSPKPDAEKAAEAPKKPVAPKVVLPIEVSKPLQELWQAQTAGTQTAGTQTAGTQTAGTQTAGVEPAKEQPAEKASETDTSLAPAQETRPKAEDISAGSSETPTFSDTPQKEETMAEKPFEERTATVIDIESIFVPDAQEEPVSETAEIPKESVKKTEVTAEAPAPTVEAVAEPAEETAEEIAAEPAEKTVEEQPHTEQAAETAPEEPAKEVPSAAAESPEEEPDYFDETFLDAEIASLLDQSDDSDSGDEFLREAGIEPPEAEEAPTDAPVLTTRSIEEGAPEQVAFDIWAEPEAPVDEPVGDEITLEEPEVPEGSEETEPDRPEPPADTAEPESTEEPEGEAPTENDTDAVFDTAFDAIEPYEPEEYSVPQGRFGAPKKTEVDLSKLFAPQSENAQQASAPSEQSGYRKLVEIDSLGFTGGDSSAHKEEHHEEK